tara:strand:- start:3548 stop:4417 length:870 start_codon:yes stop_codon:yes gene_type:complete
MADSTSPLKEIIMNTIYFGVPKFLILLIFGLVLTGCATTEENAHDPYESINRSIFSFNQQADKYVLKPVAETYKFIAPEPVQVGAGNFFSNLDDFVVVVNDILQLKFTEAKSDGSRLLINTFLGIGGLIDFGSDFGFPKRHEDFGQTLAHYGVSSGPYIVVPIFGGFTVRDGFGSIVDVATNPVFYAAPFMAPFISPTIGASKFVDERKQLLDKEEIVNEAALDKYEFLRDAYLQRRNSLIFDGSPPSDNVDDKKDGAILESSPEKKKRDVVIEYIDSEPSKPIHDADH